MSFAEYTSFFVFRYLFFSTLAWFLLKRNLITERKLSIGRRATDNILVTGIAYLIYVTISLLLSKHVDCFTGYLLFQFLVVFMLFTLTGHAYSLYIDQVKKDQEIESLKFENLKSKCDALANQIHPHFLFNTLNTLTYLVRENNKKQTLEFVNKLSNIFRYILQSEKNSIVSLKEELEFVEAFRFLMETRFAEKLAFNITVPCDKYFLKIPTLSILPLLENVVIHNVIDSDHKMVVDIFVNEKNELVVTNPVYPKTEPAVTNGTGLENLKSRFSLIMGMTVRIEKDDSFFRVYLPLKPEL
jgi:LytS/YehU family sensor histidine kinase